MSSSENSSAPPSGLSRASQSITAVLGILITAYMVYATLYGPYITSFVHLSLFALAMFSIFFMSNGGKENIEAGTARILLNFLFAALATVSFSYIIIDYQRIINLWGSNYLSTADIVFGSIAIVVALEAVRRQSIALFTLTILAIVYMLYGKWFPGEFSHPGMDFKRLIYLNVYTSEGLFGVGLNVAAEYLFMFMLFGSALQATRTGDFIMNIASATVGRQIGGAAKVAMFTSAGLGTVVGSSVGNVVATGSFTIPMMIRTGFRKHVAAAVETNTSEGAQMVPPILGAAAFIMAQITGIPYATIAVAAILPAFLYYFSLFWVIHITAIRSNAGSMSESDIPNWRDALFDGWHLILAPVALFYLLIVEKFTPSYACLITIALALFAGSLRNWSRLPLPKVLSLFNQGIKQAAVVTALIAAIGIVQAAIVTTGLGGRIADIILALSDGTLALTALLTVVAAVFIGAGMPTPIAYLLLALVAAPALELAGATKLSAHLFVFYFAIKSGSIPPIAVVATVAAGIAKADWWKTSITASIQALPSFLVAFMFLFSPELLIAGDVPLHKVALILASSSVGVLALSCGMYGWAIINVGWLSRILLIVASIVLVKPGSVTDIVGFALVIGVFSWSYVLKKRSNTDSSATAG